MTGNMVPIEVHSGILRTRFMTITAENLKEARRLKPSWAKFVRVIDIDATTKHEHLYQLLTAWKVDHYETLRFTGGAPAFRPHSLLCEQPLRIVYLQTPCFSEQMLADVTKQKEKKRVALLASPRFMGMAQRSTILHQTCPTFDLVASSGQDSPLSTVTSESLVLFFHEWDTSSPPSSETICDALEENLGVTWELLLERAGAISKRLTVVGLENLSLPAIGLEEVDKEESAEGSLAQEFIRLLKVRRLQALQCPEGIDQFSLDLLNFKTEEEYHTELDPAEREIETSRVITTIVRDWPHSDKNKKTKAEHRTASKQRRRGKASLHRESTPS